MSREPTERFTRCYFCPSPMGRIIELGTVRCSMCDACLSGSVEQAQAMALAQPESEALR